MLGPKKRVADVGAQTRSVNRSDSEDSGDLSSIERGTFRLRQPNEDTNVNRDQ